MAQEGRLVRPKQGLGEAFRAIGVGRASGHSKVRAAYTIRNQYHMRTSNCHLRFGHNSLSECQIMGQIILNVPNTVPFLMTQVNHEN